MRDRYIAFDVETPNCANDRMSAIGVAAWNMYAPAGWGGGCCRSFRTTS